MNEKENSIRIIRFNNPERVTGGYPGHGIGYRGCNHAGYTEGGDHLSVGSSWYDIWNTKWHKSHEGVMSFPVKFPLADLPTALKSYQWPDPDDERICKQIYQQAEGWNPETAFLVGSHRDTLWEKSYMLVGMEDLMCFFQTEPEAVRELLHRIMDFQLGIAKHYLNAGVEVVGMSDDLGTQHGLLLSPKIIREFFIPEYKRLFKLYKQNDVMVNFHSCGHIIPVLDVFMELGVDILNPVQATANDLDEVRRITQGHMALQGAVSSAVIMKGPKEAIRQEVAKRIWQLGRNGGYFCAPDQGMPWPEDHIRYYREAVQEYGEYPVKQPDDSKALSQERFSKYAANYVTSKAHAEGDELDRLVEITQPKHDWLVLDVATGGGHTALKFAPYVKHVTATDITPAMLETAKNFISQKGIKNVNFRLADAENLPFDNDIFNLVTCRIAPHHFPDCPKFIRECARVLKKDGILLIQDHLLPEDEECARYIDKFNKIRDPSHNMAYSESQWVSMFQNAGLSVLHIEEITKQHEFLSWVKRQDVGEDVIDELIKMVKNAPPLFMEWTSPENFGTPEATFIDHHIIISGRKEK
ncbi:methyltransferase domain-containing protein [Candidatus Poribacteria bacterium]|nr:methyltransferase domain-containing protein [Candidatus Poribacteria bacterium]